MATRTVRPTEEAVIISGPRRGELVELRASIASEQEIERALDELATASSEMAARAKALRQQTEGFVAELRKRRKKRGAA